METDMQIVPNVRTVVHPRIYIWTVRFGMNVVKSILYLYSFIVDWNTL